MKVLYFLNIFWSLYGNVSEQCQTMEDNPVHWFFSATKINETEYVLFADAIIDKDWHLYCRSQFIKSDDLVFPEITFYPNDDIEIAGFINEIGEPETIKSELIGININIFNNKVTYNTIAFKKSSKQSVSVKGEINYVACTKSKCINPSPKEFEFILN
ncbi:MAG: hypothetical protein IPM47_02300 [Sphingobacteriales bacterium]|nr:MAG: hypothetical protein IPM47_02300 [Sphingobacteriales bacterium]